MRAGSDDIVTERYTTVALCPAPDVETVTLTEGGAMLVDLKSGHCWQLNRVGAEAWSLFQGGGSSLSDVTDVLASRYAVSRSVVEADVQKVIQELTGQGLLVAANTPSRA